MSTLGLWTSRYLHRVAPCWSSDFDVGCFGWWREGVQLGSAGRRELPSLASGMRSSEHIADGSGKGNTLGAVADFLGGAGKFGRGRLAR